MNFFFINKKKENDLLTYSIQLFTTVLIQLLSNQANWLIHYLSLTYPQF